MAFKASTESVEASIRDRFAGWGRRFIFKPATLWLGWVFIASVSALGFLFVFLYRMWDVFRPSQDVLLSLAPYVLPILIPLIFFAAYAGLQYTVARGFFAVLGDASITHVNQLTPLGIIITKDEFDTFNDSILGKRVDLIGKTVVRNKVNMWGRLGGVKNWPGWDGGKRDGYYDVVYDFWDEIDGEVVHILKPCEMCKGTGQIERGHYYGPAELELLKNSTPGWRLGTTMVFPYEAWPVEFDEVPEELALAMRSDPEWRNSSRLWHMEDLLPSRISMGSAAPSNTLVTSWANQRLNRKLRDQVLEVTMMLAMKRGMDDEMGGSGGPPSVGTALGPGQR